MEFRLDYATVYVRDFERAMEFYDVALGLPLRSRDDVRGRGTFATLGAQLVVTRVPAETPADARLVGRATGVGLQVPDLDAAHEALRERGVHFAMPPTEQPEGGRIAVVEDPEGNTLVLDEAEPTDAPTPPGG